MERGSIGGRNLLMPKSLREEWASRKAFSCCFVTPRIET